MMDLTYDELFEMVDTGTFEFLLPDILNGDWRFLLSIEERISDDQFETLQPYIIDKFITVNFEQSEWERRFRLLEDAKEVYTKELFGDDSAFVKYKLADYQSIFVSKDYPDEINDTLIIPVNLFKESDLAPMEIIVWVLKTSWNKSYSTIAKMLNRDPRTIETTFKRAVAKMGSD